MSIGGRAKAIAAFLYDFVVGDDWRVAAGVALGLAVTFAVSRTSVAAWWIMPVVVAVLLPLAVVRVVRRP